MATASAAVMSEALGRLGMSDSAGTVSEEAGKRKKKSTGPVFIEPEWWPTLCLAAAAENGACIGGPRGSGKTFSVHELARRAGVTLHTFQAAKGDGLQEIVGYRDLIAKNGGTETVFTQGPLPDALEGNGGKGEWLLIEEANTMHPGIFSKMNTLLDGSGDTLRLPDGRRLAAGPNFRVFLCFNEGYIGTTDINAALKDRLRPIFADYLPPESEMKVLIDRTGCDKTTAQNLVKWAANLRKARAQYGFDLSPRSMFRMLGELRYIKGRTWKQAFESSILDLVGDPVDKGPHRDGITQIASAEGMFTWAQPTFS